ncbi:MAG: hypothetical protein ACKV0T_31540 [Planctomycetales bacterium]
MCKAPDKRRGPIGMLVALWKAIVYDPVLIYPILIILVFAAGLWLAWCALFLGA